MPERSAISRRQFLGVGSAALATSLAFTKQVSARQGVDPERKVRIGIVGGGFGASFQWHLDPGCVVEAVSDLRPDRRKLLQDVYGCPKAYESLEVLITDPAVEAVAIFTGAPDHVRHALLAMDAGKHVISAVPAAYSLEECEQLVKAKERTGLRYMMAETSWYHPEAMLLRDLYRDGVFGEIFYTECEYYHDLATSEVESLLFVDGQRTWRWGFPPMHYPTHSLAFVTGITDERITHVSGLGWGWDDPHGVYRDNPYNNPYANEVALMKTDAGNMVRCGVQWRIHAGGERAQFFGENATMYYAGSGGQPFQVQIRGQQSITSAPDYWHLLPEPLRVPSGHGNSHTFLTHEFVSALLEDREPAVDVYRALAITAPGIVAHDSALRGGEQLAVPNYAPPATEGA